MATIPQRQRGEMEVHWFSNSTREVIYYLKVSGEKLKICTINPKTTTNLTRQRVIAKEPFKERKMES